MAFRRHLSAVHTICHYVIQNDGKNHFWFQLRQQLSHAVSHCGVFRGVSGPFLQFCKHLWFPIPPIRHLRPEINRSFYAILHGLVPPAHLPHFVQSYDAHLDVFFKYSRNQAKIWPKICIDRAPPEANNGAKTTAVPGFHFKFVLLVSHLVDNAINLETAQPLLFLDI